MTRRRDVRARARRVRLLVLDVDGVLTDGRMFLSEHGDELKSFHTHDGMAVAVARRAGIKVASCSARAARRRRSRNCA